MQVKMPSVVVLSNSIERIRFWYIERSIDNLEQADLVCLGITLTGICKDLLVATGGMADKRN